MKYEIFGYDQKELMNYDIDSIDLIILDYLIFQTLNSNLKYIVHNDNRYVWITNEIISKDLPFLRFKERGIQGRIDNLAQNGFIERIQKHDTNRVKKSYMRVTDLVRKLKFKNSIVDEKINVKIENKVEETPPKKKEVLPFADETFLIFNYWNEMGIQHHRNLTEEIEKAIKKAIKMYGLETIKESIYNYSVIYNDKNYFFKYKWTLKEFLNQSNALPEFTNEGSKWLNYLNSKQGKKAQEKNILSNVKMSEGWFN